MNYGDGSGNQALSLTGKTFNLSHVYADNGTYTVTVTVTDDDGGSGFDTLTVTVNNVAPVVNAGADQAVNEVSPGVTALPLRQGLSHKPHSDLRAARRAPTGPWQGATCTLTMGRTP
ncbi:MAG: hypothetical protein HW388_75 [Dehalococcoidia bacterium]|nr:hypothetical protein [Dehalococcoidia bacterium]